VGVLKHGPRRC